MVAMLPVVATLLFACSSGQPACAAPAPYRIADGSAAAPAGEASAPRTAAPSPRLPRTLSTGHRLQRGTGALPVRFDFEPEMAGAALGRPQGLRQGRRAVIPGTSRAPPSSTHR